MALRRSSQKSLKKLARRTTPRRLQRNDARTMRLEALEDRRLMAITGPELVAVQANNGTLLRQNSVENVAPQDLTFRFDDGQVIDASTLAAIQITRLSDNTVVQPGFVGIGESPNEVVVRFAETLRDDTYRVNIGAGNVQLRNSLNQPFQNVGRIQTPFTFGLNLGAQVTAVVPQPVTRGTNGQLSQARNQIVVYFNDDDLHTQAISSTAPGAKPTVVDPQFYQLIYTNDTVTNEDGGANGTSAGTTFRPTQIDYDPVTDRAVLTFATDLDALPTGAGTYRLRIGTNEVLPAIPVEVSASVEVRSDFNTNHQVEILLTPDLSVAEGSEIAVHVSKAELAANVDPNDAASYLPDITVNGRNINVVLKTADLDDPTARGTTAAQLVTALNIHPQAGALVTAAIASGGLATNLANRTIDYSPLLLVDPGSRFTTANDLGEMGFSFTPGADERAKSIIVSSAIDKQFFPLNFPGAQDEPGHRDIPIESHLANPGYFSPSRTASEEAGTDVADRNDGITTIPYNFRVNYGRENVISETQKQRAREILEIYSDLLGVQFVETADQGFIIATGDLAGVGAVSDPNDGLASVIGPNILDGRLTVVLDNAEDWNDEFGVRPSTSLQASWFEEAMQAIGVVLGLGASSDLAPLTVQGEEFSLGVSSTGVPFARDDNSYPGDHDIVHGQHVHRPDSKDIDLYRFEVNEIGRFTAETFAERQIVASHLDTVISLYRENGDGTRTLISRNDDYYSKDSFVEMDLTPGVYYVAVSASGNIDFDPENGDTGIGGKTDGDYDLRLSFRPQAEASIIDVDRTLASSPSLQLPDSQPLDGDGDGVPGGVFNFWFQTGQTLFVDKAKPATTLSAAISTLAGPVTISVADARIFPAAPFDIRIDNEELRVTAVDLTNNRLTATRGVNGTLPATHALGARVVRRGDGTLGNPFDSIPQAVSAVTPNTRVIRLLGNYGPTNNPLAPLTGRTPYIIGRDPATGQALRDGSELEVPQGVTLMIDEGAVFKMRRSSIVVGSTLPTADRSRSAIQVLGTPTNNVIFTSYSDDRIGADTNVADTRLPSAGDWGGIVIRNDVDRQAGNRFDYERQGIFLNYINQADIRYGGGLITLGSDEIVVTPVHMIDARPTVTNNVITRSAGAAMSANPDSFEESNFHDPATQRQAYDAVTGDRPFTVDYRRVGPEIHGNRLVLLEQDPANPTQMLRHDNSLNGLFVRISTSELQPIETMTVSGRFDDKDIVHIIQENLEIEGTPGGLGSERYAPAPAPVPLARLAGGALPAGSYNYFVTFIDADGVEGPRSEISNSSILSGGPTQGTIRLRISQPPIGDFTGWRLYRSAATGIGPYTLVTQQLISVNQYDDNGATVGGSYNGAAQEPIILPLDPTDPLDLGGNLGDGTFNYFVTFVDDRGIEGPASPLSANVVIVPGTTIRRARLQIEEPPFGDFATWKLYRSQANGRGPYTLVAEQDASVDIFDDFGATTGLQYSGSFQLVERGRLDARLKIDPSVVVKAEAARIEVTMGAQLIAEGRDGAEVIFTSLLDDRYGAGGTFDTAHRTGDADAGNWGGLYIGHTSSASLDHAIVAYGGGATRIEGGFGNFNALEIHQSDVRVANSLFEFNGDGRRVFDPVDDPDRVGRGRNAPGVIFVRGAQPVIVNNIIRGSETIGDTIVPAITINVNALNSELVTDWGRTTGEIGLFAQRPNNSVGADVFAGSRENQGPLVRGNILVGDPTNPASTGAINGMVVRGNALTTEGVWDDTDIVHVLLNEVLIPDFHTKGGLRLESSAAESLVVKLFGPDAGFAANGQPLDIDDRIGGSLYIVGQPGHPVVLTSLRDDTQGAGSTLTGGPNFDTNNDGSATAPAPGDWRSVRLLQYANDRNVATIVEREAHDVIAPGLNAVPENAQLLGELGFGELAGDDVRRLGFEVHGFLNARNDVDVYSFRARTGTEVWFDIDNTTHSLDTVIELIDANGVVIARSDNSLDEATDPSRLYFNPTRIVSSHVSPLRKSAFGIDDHFSTNPRDAGMRIILPGSTNAIGTYHVRVRSAGMGMSAPDDPILAGRSEGRYELQVRLREMDEVPGTTITNSEIRWATIGVDIQGLPKHSQLAGELAEDGTPNQVRADAQDLGNLLRTDRGAISVAGFLDQINPQDPSNPNPVPPGVNSLDPDDVDWYSFEIDYESVQFLEERGAGVVFDLDFADNLGRPDIRLSIFDSQGRLILSSDDSNISEDVSAPLGGTAANDVKRGSAGTGDAFLGPIQLPVGTYFVAVSHAFDIPRELSDVIRFDPANPEIRLEPMESVVRIAEDHIGLIGGGTVQPQRPLTPLFTGAGTLVPYDLSDVTLFVATSGGEQTQLFTVDPFSGQRETFLSNEDQFGIADIAMRGDGTLFAYSVDRVGQDAPNDAQQGRFLQFDPGTGQATLLRDDGIETYEPDNNGNPTRTHPFPPPNGGRIGHGITFNATTFNRNASLLYAVGTRGSNFAPYEPGAAYAENIMFRMSPSDFDTDNIAAGLPLQARQFPLGDGGTNFVDEGTIPTAFDLFGNSMSVLISPAATLVAQNPGGTTTTTFIIQDGDTFDVEVDTDGNGTPDVGPVTFELNSGPEANINFNLANNEFFVDGEFFTLDNLTFEFDTGEVLVPDTSVQPGAEGQPGRLNDGATITVTDNTGAMRTFEIDRNGLVNGTNIPLPVTDTTTIIQLTNTFIAALNSQPTFNARATLSNGRVTLTGDRGVTLQGGETGFDENGNTGPGIAGAIAIPIEENFTPGEVIQQILNVMNGVPGAPQDNVFPEPPPGVPGIEASAAGSRINFYGATNGDFDSMDTGIPSAPGTPRFMTGVPGSDGNVTQGNIEVPFFAGDSGEDIAQRVIAAVEDLRTDDPNDPNDPFDPTFGVIATTTVPPSRTVRFNVDPAVHMNPSATVIVTPPPNSPFDQGGAAPGGHITGMAYIPDPNDLDGDFVFEELYAVSENGGLYNVHPELPPIFPQLGVKTVVTDYIESSVDLAQLFDPTTTGRRLMGLTAGPPNLQGGAYSGILFGIDNFGRIHAFDTNGTLQPVFQNGSTFVDTNLGGAVGLAFSTLDYNPWHATVRFDATTDPFRWEDPGHGIEPVASRSLIFTESGAIIQRDEPQPREGSIEAGNSSLYFGNALVDMNPADPRFTRALQTLTREGRTIQSLGQEPGDFKTYDFPGGAHGSAVSAPFSLEGYSAADLPTLYFNYFLDTEDANSAGQPARDTFRVYVASDDPTLPADPVFAGAMIQGQWYLAATNNVVNDNNGNPTIAADLPGLNGLRPQALHDSSAGWRQARIDLSSFAGLDNIRLRFDFSTAGSMDFGSSFFGFGGTGGEELRAMPGSDLRDGQTFQIGGQVFEFDLGVTLVAPTGDAIADGETFTISDQINLPVNFEFHNDNTFQRNIRAQDGSFFQDGEIFTITDQNGVTQAFEFESGYTLILPQASAIRDGHTFSIDADGDGPQAPVVYEFDTADPAGNPEIAATSDIAININTDQAIVIPSAGSGFGGVRDGDTFQIRDQNNDVFVFEFDSNNLVGQTGGNPHIAVPISLAPPSTQDAVANAVVAAINGQNMNPDVTATHVGGGEVRLGELSVSVDTGGTPSLQRRFIPGTREQIADLIVAAIQGAGQGLTPLHTTRLGGPTGEVHIGGTTHVLDTSGAPSLRQRGEPGLTDPNALPVPFIPDEGFTPAQVADAIEMAINDAFAAGFDVSASVSNNVVILSGTNFGFSPGSTALTPDGIIPVAFNDAQSAAEVAAAMAAAIANSPLRDTVLVHLVGNRVNLEVIPPAGPLTVQQGAGRGAATPGVNIDGASGNVTGTAVPIHAEMTVQQVRDAIANVLNATFAPAAAAQGISVFPVHDNVIRVHGQSIDNAGPLGVTSDATSPGGTALPGDQNGAFTDSNPARRGLNNRFEGVFVDDIIIGFAERGEMVTRTNQGNFDDQFVHLGNFGTVGAYQLEIRRASEYGVGSQDPFLQLVRSFDTNDRLSRDFTLFAPAGSEISPTSTFTISDGVDAVVFEYVNRDVAGAEPMAGNVPIYFSPDDPAEEVARSIRDTINSLEVQQNRRLNVAAAAVSSGNRVDLVGDNVNVNIIQPALSVDEVVTDANALRDAILGSDVTPIGEATLTGGAFAAGFFSGGTTSIGIERGIVISTGNVNNAVGPNVSDSSGALSSRVGDPGLDDEFGVVTQDSTAFEFSFQLSDTDSRDLFFNFVFASEEYNEQVNTGVNDVFAFFLDGQNIALVPGTTEPVSIATVNGGNPFGSASSNPQFYNNNDPTLGDNGQFLSRFGLDGFTSVFAATARDLPPGVHTIRIVLGDVLTSGGDSAVFIESGSFSSVQDPQLARTGITGIQHNEIGDENRVRDQGQLIISNNQIFDAAQWGISVTPGARDPRTGASPLGAVRNLEELNDERLLPGVVIRNNIVARAGTGGLLFSGDAGGAGLMPAAVPFGRIVNNTFFGTGSNDTGIQVQNNAGPTLMNNIVANFATGIFVDASSQSQTVVASTLYQNNAVNSNVANTNFPVVLAPNDPLFLDPANDNFYLAPMAQAIDSSIDSIQERASLRDVKASINVPPSNVLAPDRDVLGQVRRDDPTFQPPFGAGQVVFKDRGAVDRVDFQGPSAEVIVPRDNDAEGLDQNPALFAVRTSGQLVTEFVIKLLDGVEPVDPNDGTGVDPTTVTSQKVRIEFFAPSDVNLTRPTLLREGIDYTFAFNPLNDSITLKDVGGLYLPGFYRITLDNTPINPGVPNDDGQDAIRDLAGNPLKPNQGSQTAFLIEVPDNLDFGDAPESYGTTIDSDGPRHVIRPNFFLGTTVDAELDGQPSDAANGDGADEDGVRIGGQSLAGRPLNVGATIALEVFASAPGRLDAWIDFNRNGAFEPSEKVASGVNLNSASNIINVAVPDVPPELEEALLGPTFARFRFSSTGVATPNGPAIDGEVEDYQITLQRSDSDWQNPSNNLDVNADGLVTLVDALLIVSDIRDNREISGENVHQLFPTREQAQNNVPPQLFVAPRRPPFVDVNGDSLVTVADLQQVITALRNQINNGGNGEAEGEAAELAAVELAAEELATQSAAPLGWDLGASQRRDDAAAPRDEERTPSAPADKMSDALILANSSFRTFDFESALSDIADDIADAWSDEGAELGDLEDYFPYTDVLNRSQR